MFPSAGEEVADCGYADYDLAAPANASSSPGMSGPGEQPGRRIPEAFKIISMWVLSLCGNRRGLHPMRIRAAVRPLRRLAAFVACELAVLGYAQECRG